VPTGDANVNGFLAARNIGEAQLGLAAAKERLALTVVDVTRRIFTRALQ